MSKLVAGAAALLCCPMMAATAFVAVLGDDGKASGPCDPNPEPNPITVVGEGSHVATGVKFLTSRGLTVPQAAGILGNLQVESGPALDPTARNSLGYTGIAQWDPHHRWPLENQFAKKLGKSKYDYGVQLEYLAWEMGLLKNVWNKPAPYPQVGAHLKNAPSVSAATRVIFAEYEVAGDSSFPKREAYARVIATKYSRKAQAQTVSDAQQATVEPAVQKVGGGTSKCGTDPAPTGNGWAVTGKGAMNVFYQYKPPWATKPYGFGTVRVCGCGPTSTSMIVRTLTKDSKVNPAMMAQYFAAHHAQIPDCGSSWDLWNTSSPLAKQYHLKFTDLGTDLSKVKKFVTHGGFGIMSQGPGIFTNTGHIMVLRGVTKKGNYLVADPASDVNTNNAKGFSSEQIIGHPGNPGMVSKVGYLKHVWGVEKK